MTAMLRSTVRRIRPGRALRSAGAVAALSLVPLGLAGPASAAGWNAHLTRAPYLTDLVGRHVNVNWATDRAVSTGSLRWGPYSGGRCSLTYRAAPRRVAFVVGSVAEYQWTASLTLPSSGSFCYRPVLGSVDLLGTNASPAFTAQVPAGSTGTFSFAVFGDWGLAGSGSTNPDQTNLMRRIATSGVRFAVSTGDIGYPSGNQLNYGDLHQSGPNISTIFGPSFWTVAGSTVPLFAASGNHGLTGSASAKSPRHTDLTTWTEDVAVSSSRGTYADQLYPAINGSRPTHYGNTWYAVQAGRARIYVLTSAWGDTNGGTANPYANDAAAHFSPGAAEYRWLAADLAAHRGGLKIAISHYPFYADNPHQSSDTYLQGPARLEGLLARNGVRMVLNGHAHMYQRNTPSAAGMPVTYVTGGGGALLETIGPCSARDAYGVGWSPTKGTGTACGAARVPTSSGQVHHFLKVTVGARAVTVTPIDSTGRAFDVQTYRF
jgi:hypothetical protein